MKYRVTVYDKNQKVLAVYKNQTSAQTLELERRGLRDPEVVLTKSEPEKEK